MNHDVAATGSNSILDLTGSQCSDGANTGEMCSLFFVLVRTRAAAFWTSCRVFNDLLLEPDNKELQLSSLDVTKAWTSFSASFWERTCLIFLILRKWKKAVLGMYFKLEFKDKSESKITPKFLTVSLEARAMSSSAAISLDNASLRCLGPSIITSVLSEFNKRKLRVICNTMWWSIVLNAALRSNRTRTETNPSSDAIRRSLVTFAMAVSVLWTPTESLHRNYFTGETHTADWLQPSRRF